MLTLTSKVETEVALILILAGTEQVARICQSLCVNVLGFVVGFGVDVGVVFGVAVGFWFCCWGWVAREGGSSPSFASHVEKN